ncbi:hypothetical protein D3C79_817960 [compost metagenome]
MLGRALAELVQMDGDQLGILAVVHHRVFAQRLQVVEHFPELGHFFGVGVHRVLTAHGHGPQLAQCAFVLAVAHRHHDA